jgi:hypothetical protein
MYWRFQLYVLPKNAGWRVSLHEDGRPAPRFTREFETQDAAIRYADTVARLLDPKGTTSRVWADVVP